MQFVQWPTKETSSVPHTPFNVRPKEWLGPAFNALIDWIVRLSASVVFKCIVALVARNRAAQSKKKFSTLTVLKIYWRALRNFIYPDWTKSLRSSARGESECKPAASIKICLGTNALALHCDFNVKTVHSKDSHSAQSNNGNIMSQMTHVGTGQTTKDLSNR